MPLERTNYFYGQVLGVEEFTQEQAYHRGKARLHNRMLHGYGLVWGLEVGKGPDGAVTIEPGYALDQHGEEIHVERKVVVDLRTEDPDGNSVAACADDEPGVRVAVGRPVGKPLHIAIRYAECGVAPVPVASEGGDETVYSRTRESFVVRALAELPTGYGARAGDEPGDAWLILADVVLDSDFEIESIGFANRRPLAR
jgi:hypothetical protein